MNNPPLMINHLPVIRAFAGARIETISRREAPVVRLARLEELRAILTLCDGLEKQSELLALQMASAVRMPLRESPLPFGVHRVLAASPPKEAA